jgi:hypothetical protein
VHLLNDDRGPVIETLVARTLRQVRMHLSCGVCVPGCALWPTRAAHAPSANWFLLHVLDNGHSPVIDTFGADAATANMQLCVRCVRLCKGAEAIGRYVACCGQRVPWSSNLSLPGSGHCLCSPAAAGLSCVCMPALRTWLVCRCAASSIQQATQCEAFLV